MNGYMQAITNVLRKTDATERSWRTYGRRKKLLYGVPHTFIGHPVVGPQCVTITLRIRNEDLSSVLSLGDRFAMAANSEMARVYRDLNRIRVEFTLPRYKWRDVQLSGLPHHPGSAAIGQTALGPVARVGWDTPHKAIFGGTQTGKTTCMVDFIISLARAHQPDDCCLIVLNPKNDPKFQPLERLKHLQAPIATDYDDSTALLRFTLAEMERRRQDNKRTRQRLVVFVDEIAQLTEVRPETGIIITQLGQMAGGLNINLVVASQAANPRVFGKNGSLTQANFGSRLVFQLPAAQSYLATGLSGLHTEKLSREGDALAISNQVIRFRAALPGQRDFDDLPYTEIPPAMPNEETLVGEAAIDTWPDPDRVAYALAVKNSATAIQKQFGGGTTKARRIRDYVDRLQQRINYWQLEGGSS